MAQGQFQVAGGISADQQSMEVQSFIALNCNGSINRVIPGQFLGATIGEVMGAAQLGDPAARKCLKLLKEDRFRKP